MVSVFALFLILGLSSTAMALEGTVEVEVDQPDTSTEVTEAEQGENVDINVAVTGDEEVFEPDVNINVNPGTSLALDIENSFQSLDGIHWQKYGDNNHLFSEHTSAHHGNFLDENSPGSYHWDLNSLAYYRSEAGDRLFTGTAWLKIPAKVLRTGLITINANLVDDERMNSLEQEGLLIDEDTTTLTGIAAGGSTDSTTTPETTTNTAAATTNTVPMQKTGTPIIPAIIGLLSIIGGSMYARLR